MGSRATVVGDRVRLSGGYDMDPGWLVVDSAGCVGRVVAFIPGQNDQPAMVVELDEELVLPHGAGAVNDREVRGRFAVLELGHVGTDWSTSRPRVHVELCADRPPPRPWNDRPQGAWVESHGTYEVVA